MPLINLIITLIVVGVLLWLVNTYIPMDRKTGSRPGGRYCCADATPGLIPNHLTFNIVRRRSMAGRAEETHHVQIRPPADHHCTGNSRAS